jgi:hypothetical protein
VREIENCGLKRERYERRDAKHLRERPAVKNVYRQFLAENCNDAVNGKKAHYGCCENIKIPYK